VLPLSPFQVIVGGQASNILTFLKPVPSFTMDQPRQYTGMSTLGGEYFEVVGMANIGVEPCNITIGGRQCAPVVKTVTNGRLITDSLAIFTLSCNNTPAGVGANLPIIVSTTGGSSRVNTAFLYSYASPTLYSTPVVEPDGSALIPTVGASVVLSGINLGGTALTSNIAAYLDEVSA
jgi:hypothetical protein